MIQLPTPRHTVRCIGRVPCSDSSMPGYGYSGKPTTTGWDCVRMARAWTVLMKRLGYTRFVAQGGDWGGVVVDEMGVQAPPKLIGFTANASRGVTISLKRL